MRLPVPSSPKSYPSETMPETRSHRKPDCTSRKPFRVAQGERDPQPLPSRRLLRDQNRCRRRGTGSRVKPGSWQKQTPRKQQRTKSILQLSTACARDDRKGRHQTTRSKPSCRDALPTTTEPKRSIRLNPSHEG